MYAKTTLMSFFFVYLCSFTVACTESETVVASGQQLYEAPHRDGNTFACSTCHALEEPAGDGLRRPGHAIGDAVVRPDYKNGQLATMLEAVNSCRQEWMAAQAWSTDDQDWIALEEFLLEKAPARAPSLEFTRVEPPTGLICSDPSSI